METTAVKEKVVEGEYEIAVYKRHEWITNTFGNIVYSKVITRTRYEIIEESDDAEYEIETKKRKWGDLWDYREEEYEEVDIIKVKKGWVKIYYEQMNDFKHDEETVNGEYREDVGHVSVYEGIVVVKGVEK